MTFWLLREKTTSWACWVTSGLNDSFRWFSQLEILIKLSFSCNDDRLILWITEKIEVSSPKSLANGDRFIGRSLIYTKNNRYSKIEPWGTPASTVDHEDNWLFNKTLWNRQAKDLLIGSSQSLNEF